MEVKDFISSGILELYVLNQVSLEDKRIVEAMSREHPEVKEEILAISAALEKYAISAGIEAPASLKSRLFEGIGKSIPTNISDKSSNDDNLRWNPLNTFITAIALLGFSLYLNSNINHKEEKASFAKQMLVCDSINEVYEANGRLMSELKNSHINAIKISPSPGYQNTNIILHYNSQDSVNYLQLNQLPPIGRDQVYQLWSIKEGLDPIPMDTFTDEEFFVKVAFEHNTKAYAITIEQKPGSLAPDLTKLIGTFTPS